jgi:hypothetical protein
MDSSLFINTDDKSVSTSRCTQIAIPLLVLAGAIVSVTPSSPAFAQADEVRFDAAKQIPGTPNQDAEPPHIAASGKNVYIIWHEFPTAASMQPDVFIARSRRETRTYFSRIAVMPDGVLITRKT